MCMCICLPLIDMTQWFMSAYIQQHFVTVPEYEYYKIQIMKSLNEPITGKTQMSRGERIFCLLSASLKNSEVWEVLWKKELGKHKHNYWYCLIQVLNDP